MVVVGSSSVSTSSTAASALIIPAPAPTRPADGMNVLVNCSAAFVSLGVSDRLASSTSAAAPLTKPAAMLVPDSCITAFAPVPDTCREGYVFDRYESTDSADRIW